MLRTPPAIGCLRDLNPEETTRLRHFRQPADQWRILLGRTILRMMLAEEHGIPSANIVLTAKGKPVLAESHQRFDFSITHDGPWVAVGITITGLIGIDISAAANFHEWDTLVPGYLHLAEIQQLHELSASEVPLASARLWTAKEAILKAAGYGLELDPRGIVLQLATTLAIRQLPHGLPPPELFHLQEHGLFDGNHLAIAQLFDIPTQPAAPLIQELRTEALPCVQAAARAVLSP